MHDDDLPVDETRVRRLLARDRPDLAGRPLRRVSAGGSSNALYRLGDEYAVRLPRQPGGSATIGKEQRWLPYLAPHLPVAVPRVLHVGEPGFGYPERWSVTGWLAGAVPSTPVEDGPAADALARDLAAAVTALHAVAVPPAARADPELRWYRGGPPAVADAEVRAYLDACRDLPDLGLDLGACAAEWAAAVALPAGGSSVFVHADLLPENLLVRDGRLAAVLDFGGLCVGDPAVDLVPAWALFGPRARAVFRDAAAVDDATWRRARGWALGIALMIVPYYRLSLPGRAAAALVTARQVLADRPA